MTFSDRINAFDQARLVEQRGMMRLKPWLDRVAHEGRWTWIAKSNLALMLQKMAGDALVAVGEFDSFVVEMKFLQDSRDAPFEVYSNRVLMPDGSVDRIRSKRGWALTCNADLIGIYNISSDRGVIGRLPLWKAFLFERMENGLQRWQVRELREQNRRQQRNSSWIIWTNYGDLVRHCGFIEFSARQLELLERRNPFGAS